MLGSKAYLIFILSGFLVLFSLNVRAEKYSYYVSPDGNDFWEGSNPDKPFASIQKARDLIREIGKKDDTITVYLRGGEYRLSETFTLGPEDSGSDSCPVIYAAMPGETPIIKGDKLLQEGDVGQLMVFLGSPEEEKFVEHIIISGITFSGSGIRASDDQSYSGGDSGISSLVALEYVRFCSFSDNKICDAQIPALQVYGKDNTVLGNTISNVRDGAILIKGKGNIISDNFIKDVQYSDEHERPGWGVCLDSKASEAVIENNIIVRAGVSLWMKGQNKNIRVQNNICVNPVLSLVKLSNPADKNHEHISLSRNIFYYRNDDVDIFTVKGKGSLPEESDSNIFWNPTACIWTSKVIRGIGPTTGLAEWQSIGYEINSLVENPLFIDIRNDNYSLKDESVAFLIGFKDINWSD